MADSKQKLLDVYKVVESNLRKVGTNVFNEIPNTGQKLISKQICMVLLNKMQNEMLQGRFLELKNDIIRSGVRQTEIVDPTIESLERLFWETGFLPYVYVANMLIMLMRRVALGVEYVGDVNAMKIIDLYPEVSKTYYQRDFDKFKAAFKDLINPGVSLVDFIYAKTHQYLAYHYRFQGPKHYGILTMTKYHKLRFRFGMYTKIENILVEILLVVVQALDYELCMLKQARHLISFVYTHIKRLEVVKQETTVGIDKLKLLKQLNIIAESLYLAVNLQKSYENMMKKTDIGLFFDKCEKMKDDEVEEIDVPIRLARNQVELQTLYQKLCGFKSFVNEPVLSTIFDAIKASVQASSFFSKIIVE